MPNIQQLPNYNSFNEVLESDHFPLNAAECHGLATGIICVTDNANHALTALLDLFPNEEENQFIDDDTEIALKSLCEVTAQQLADINFSFQLLLPNDEISLTERSTTIRTWCQGLISGLGEGGIKFESTYAKELQEIVSDLTAIAQVDTQSIAHTEEEEASFMELSEYVRIAAITIYTDLLLENKNIVTPDMPQQIH